MDYVTSPYLNKKAKNALVKYFGDPVNIEEVASHTEVELLCMKEFGRKSLNHLKIHLFERGLSLPKKSTKDKSNEWLGLINRIREDYKRGIR